MRESKYPEGPKSCRVTEAQAAIWTSATVRAALNGINFPQNNPENWTLPSGRSIDTTLCKKLLFLFIEQDLEADEGLFSEEEMIRVNNLIKEMVDNGEIEL